MPPYQSSTCQITVVDENVTEDRSINFVSTTHESSLTDKNDTTSTTEEELDCESSPPVAGTTRPAACRHRVSFDDAHRVHTVPSHEDYTYMERKSTWCSPYELLQSKFNMEKSLTRLEKGKPCKKEMTYRGLDQWTPAGTKRLQESATEVKRVVMHEQNRQRELQRYDPEAIASRCSSVSAVSVQRAIELAKEDEEEIQELRFLETYGTKCKSSKQCKQACLQQERRRRSWWSRSRKID